MQKNKTHHQHHHRHRVRLGAYSEFVTIIETCSTTNPSEESTVREVAPNHGFVLLTVASFFSR